MNEPLFAQREARNATKVGAMLQLKLYVGAIILPLVGRVSRTTTGPSARRRNGIPILAFWREGSQKYGSAAAKSQLGSVPVRSVVPRDDSARRYRHSLHPLPSLKHMALYVVSYDLSRPEQEYPQLLEYLH